MSLERYWRDVCRAVLGEEIGPVDEYRAYLHKHLEQAIVKKSEISGREVVVSVPYFCESAGFIENTELEAYNKILRDTKLDVNEVKDIDSVLQALGDKLYYCGSIVTGNSREVSKSDGVANSFFVYESSEVYDSKYVAFSNSVRSGEYVFGTNWSGDDKFLLKGYETFNLVRCMEVVRTALSSDCYYVASVDECRDCMFSFNQMGKRNLIGNREFPKDEYAKLKNKLLEDIRNELRNRKTLPTVVEIMGAGIA